MPEEHSAALHGPYLETAVICERVLEERDGVLSLIRVVDRLELMAIQPPGATPAPPVPPVQLFVVVGFKSGDARGRHQLRLTMERPNGMRQLLAEVPLLLEGDDRGARAILALAFGPEMEGVHWVDVHLDDKWFTRMPLRVVFLAYRTG